MGVKSILGKIGIGAASIGLKQIGLDIDISRDAHRPKSKRSADEWVRIIAAGVYLGLKRFNEEKQ